MVLTLSKSAMKKIKELKLYYHTEGKNGLLCTRDEYAKYKRGEYDPDVEYEGFVEVYEELDELMKVIKAN